MQLKSALLLSLPLTLLYLSLWLILFSSHHVTADLSSSNNITYTDINTFAVAPPRVYAACAQAAIDLSYPANGSYFVIGGSSYNDVWNSVNEGVTFNQVTSAANFSPRQGAMLGYLKNGNLILVGGSSQYDVWISTTSGQTWSRQLTSGPWGTSYVYYGASYAVLPNTNIMMLVSGYQRGAAYVNMDGQGLTWTTACSSSCPFSGYLLYSAMTALYDQSTWVVIGGENFASTTTISNIVAYSTNLGVSWTTYAGPFTGRYGHSVVSDTDGYVYVYGGLPSNFETWLNPTITSSSTWQKLVLGYDSTTTPQYASCFFFEYTNWKTSNATVQWKKTLVLTAGYEAFPVNPGAIGSAYQGTLDTVTVPCLPSQQPLDVYNTSLGYNGNSYARLAIPTDYNASTTTTAVCGPLTALQIPAGVSEYAILTRIVSAIQIAYAPPVTAGYTSRTSTNPTVIALYASADDTLTNYASMKLVAYSSSQSQQPTGPIPSYLTFPSSTFTYGTGYSGSTALSSTTKLTVCVASTSPSLWMSIPLGSSSNSLQSHIGSLSSSLTFPSTLSASSAQPGVLQYGIVFPITNVTAPNLIDPSTLSPTQCPPPANGVGAAVVGTDIRWVSADANPGMSARYGAACLQNHMTFDHPENSSYYVIGGYSLTNGYVNDVWKSTVAGAAWSRVDSGSSPYSYRYYHGAAGLANGNIVVWGGTPNNDIWYSTNDGSTWTRSTTSWPWTYMYYFAYASFPNTNILMMTGGYQGGQAASYVSFDGTGANWYQSCSGANACGYPYPNYNYWYYVRGTALYDSQTFVVTGGEGYYYYNYVGYSQNFGASWTTYAGPFGGRYAHGCTADIDNFVYIYGGYGYPGAFSSYTSYMNDVWYSSNVMNGPYSWRFVDAVITGVPAAAQPMLYTCLYMSYDNVYNGQGGKQLLVATGYSSSGGYTNSVWWGELNLPVYTRPNPPTPILPTLTNLIGPAYASAQGSSINNLQAFTATQYYYYCTPLSSLPSTSTSYYLNQFVLPFGFLGATSSPIVMYLYGSSNGDTTQLNLIASTCPVYISKNGFPSLVTIGLGNMTFASGYSSSTALPSSWQYSVCIQAWDNLLVLSLPSSSLSGSPTMLVGQPKTDFYGSNIFTYPATLTLSTSPSTDNIQVVAAAAGLSTSGITSSAAICPALPPVPGKVVWSEVSVNIFPDQGGRIYAACAKKALNPLRFQNDTLLLIGGYPMGTSTYYNDIWQSFDDGQTWSTISVSSSSWFSPRTWAALGILANGNILYVGGYSGNVYQNDVWISTNGGYAWAKQSLTSQPWTYIYRAGYAVLPNTNYFMIAGGEYFGNNKVYLSKDGVGLTWSTQCTTTCPWTSSISYIYDASLAGLYDQKTWIFASGVAGGVVSNIVGYSQSMGTSWTTYNAPYAPRYNVDLLVDLDNYVYAVGGTQLSTTLSDADVWFITDITQGGSGWTMIALTAGSVSDTYVSAYANCAYLTYTTTTTSATTSMYSKTLVLVGGESAGYGPSNIAYQGVLTFNIGCPTVFVQSNQNATIGYTDSSYMNQAIPSQFAANAMVCSPLAMLQLPTSVTAVNPYAILNAIINTMAINYAPAYSSGRISTPNTTAPLTNMALYVSSSSSLTDYSSLSLVLSTATQPQSLTGPIPSTLYFTPSQFTFQSGYSGSSALSTTYPYVLCATSNNITEYMTINFGSVSNAPVTISAALSSANTFPTSFPSVSSSSNVVSLSMTFIATNVTLHNNVPGLNLTAPNYYSCPLSSIGGRPSTITIPAVLYAVGNNTQVMGQRYNLAYTQTALNASSPAQSSLYVIGGYAVLNGIYSYRNDVWKSTDGGLSWNLRSNPSNTNMFGQRYESGLVTLANGVLIFFGGYQASSPYGYFNDIWASYDDGWTWSQSTDSAPFQPGYYFGYAALPNTNIFMKYGGIIVYPGTQQAEAWVSQDGTGATWTQVCNSPTGCGYPSQSTTYYYLGMTGLYDSKTFVVAAGYCNGYTNQVAYSSNLGVSWTTYFAPWGPRYYVSLVTDISNDIYLYGGYSYNQYTYTYAYTNDLWYCTDYTNARTWSLIEAIATSTSVPLPSYGEGFYLTYHWDTPTSSWRKQLVLAMGYSTNVGNYIGTTVEGTLNTPVIIVPPPPAIPPVLPPLIGTAYKTIATAPYPAALSIAFNAAAATIYCGPLTYVPDQSQEYYVNGLGFLFSPATSQTVVPTILYLYGQSNVQSPLTDYTNMVLIAYSCPLDARAGQSQVNASLSQINWANGFGPSSALSTSWGYTVCAQSLFPMVYTSLFTRTPGADTVTRNADVVTKNGEAQFVVTAPSRLSATNVAVSTSAIATAAFLSTSSSSSVSVVCKPLPPIPSKITWGLVNSLGLGGHAREYSACAQRSIDPANRLANTFVIFGGYNYDSTTSPYTFRYNDVWSSIDGGQTWSELDGATYDFQPRQSHAAAFLSNGNLLVIGGYGSSYYNDVWLSTTGGNTWSQVSGTKPWSTYLYGAGYATLPNTNIFMLIGGYASSKVFVNRDGVGTKWETMCSGGGSSGTTAACPWSSSVSYVYYSSAIGLYDQQTFVFIGGYQTNGIYSNQVAYTTTMGVSWTYYNAPFAGRQLHQIVADLDNYVYVVGGEGSSYMTDVWVATNYKDVTTWTSIALSPASVAANNVASYSMCLFMTYTLQQETATTVSYHKTLVSSQGISLTWGAEAVGETNQGVLSTSIPCPLSTVANTSVVAIGHNSVSETRATLQSLYWGSATFCTALQQLRIPAYAAALNRYLVLTNYIDSLAVQYAPMVTAGFGSSSATVSMAVYESSSGSTSDYSSLSLILSTSSVTLNTTGPIPSTLTFPNSTFTYSSSFSSGGYQVSSSSTYTVCIMPSATVSFMNVPLGSSVPTVYVNSTTSWSSSQSFGNSLSSAIQLYINMPVVNGTVPTTTITYNVTTDASACAIPTYSGGIPIDVPHVQWTTTNTPTTSQPVSPARYYALCAQSAISPLAPNQTSLFVIAGDTTYGYSNDVWRSTDNAHDWTRMTDAAQFPERYFGGAAKLINGITVVFGGYAYPNYNYVDDVWYSTNDGVTWTLSTSSAWGGGRAYFAYANLPNTNIIMIYGGAYTGVSFASPYVSFDGLGSSWSQGCTSATSCAFQTTTSPTIYYPAMTGLYDQQTFVIAGGEYSYPYSNTVLMTVDFGNSFSTYKAPWTGRYMHRLTSDLDNWVYVYGGYQTTGYANDLWYTTDVTRGASAWNVILSTVNSISISQLPYEGFCMFMKYNWNQGTTNFNKEIVVSTGYAPSGGMQAASWIGNMNVIARINASAVVTPPGSVLPTFPMIGPGYQYLASLSNIYTAFLPMTLTENTFYCTPLSSLPDSSTYYLNNFRIALLGSGGGKGALAMYLYRNSGGSTTDYSNLQLIASTCPMVPPRIFTFPLMMVVNQTYINYASGFSATTALSNSATYSVCVQTTAPLVALGVNATAASISPSNTSSYSLTFVATPPTTPTLSGGAFGTVAVVAVQVGTSSASGTQQSCPSYPPATYRISWSMLARGAVGYREGAAHSQSPLSNVPGAVPTFYLTGGVYSGYYNDVWTSTNAGLTWTRVSVTAPFTGRYGHAQGLLANGNLIVLGGYGYGSCSDYNVWTSLNGGVVWNISTSSGPVSSCTFGVSYAVLPNTNIFMIITNNQGAYVNMDGIGASWTRVCYQSQCGFYWNQYDPNYYYLEDAALVGLYDQQTWVLTGGIGYSYSNMVSMSTSIGSSWLTYQAPWPARYSHSSAADLAGGVYVYGGYTTSGTSTDVWFTPIASASNSWVLLTPYGSTASLPYYLPPIFVSYAYYPGTNIYVKTLNQVTGIASSGYTGDSYRGSINIPATFPNISVGVVTLPPYSTLIGSTASSMTPSARNQLVYSVIPAATIVCSKLYSGVSGYLNALTLDYAPGFGGNVNPSSMYLYRSSSSSSYTGLSLIATTCPLAQASTGPIPSTLIFNSSYLSFASGFSSNYFLSSDYSYTVCFQSSYNTLATKTTDSTGVVMASTQFQDSLGDPSFNSIAPTSLDLPNTLLSSTAIGIAALFTSSSPSSVVSLPCPVLPPPIPQVAWVQFKSTAISPARMYAACGQTALTANNKLNSSLFIVGGDGLSIYNDIWVSYDSGNSFSTPSTSGTRFSSRYGAALGVLANGNIILAGGSALDVWLSTNQASTWTRTTTTGPWGSTGFALYSGYTVLPNTNIFMIISGYSSSGRGINGIYVTTDGRASSWTTACTSSTCPWGSAYTGLYAPAATALYDGRTFIVSGGYFLGSSGLVSLTNTVAYSRNLGVSWTNYTAPFGPRYTHDMTSDLDNYAYVFGGQGLSDLWYSTDVTNPTSWTQLSLSAHSESTASNPTGGVCLYMTYDYYYTGSTSSTVGYRKALVAVGGYNYYESLDSAVWIGSLSSPVPCPSTPAQLPQVSLGFDSSASLAVPTLYASGQAVCGSLMTLTLPPGTNRYAIIQGYVSALTIAYAPYVTMGGSSSSGGITATLALYASTSGSTTSYSSLTRVFTTSTLTLADEGPIPSSLTFSNSTYYWNTNDGFSSASSLSSSYTYLVCARVSSSAYLMAVDFGGVSGAATTHTVSLSTSGFPDSLSPSTSSANVVQLGMVVSLSNVTSVPALNYTVEQCPVPPTSVGLLPTASYVVWSPLSANSSTTALIPREGAACAQSAISIVFGRSTYFVGQGYRGDTYTYSNDLQYSTDRSNWPKVTNTDMPGRGYGAMVVLANGNLIVWSGYVYASGTYGPSNDVWLSADNGQTYTMVSSSSNNPLPSTYYLGYASLPNTNIMMSLAGDTSTAGAFVSIDGTGTTWTQRCSTPTACGYPYNYVYWYYLRLIGLYDQNTFVASAGYCAGYRNTISFTQNLGNTWTTYTAPFTPRYEHSMTTDTDGFVYIYSGYTANGQYEDVWYSPNVVGGPNTWQLIGSLVASTINGDFPYAYSCAFMSYSNSRFNGGGGGYFSWTKNLLIATGYSSNGYSGAAYQGQLTLPVATPLTAALVVPWAWTIGYDSRNVYANRALIQTTALSSGTLYCTPLQYLPGNLAVRIYNLTALTFDYVPANSTGLFQPTNAAAVAALYIQYSANLTDYSGLTLVAYSSNSIPLSNVGSIPTRATFSSGTTGLVFNSAGGFTASSVLPASAVYTVCIQVSSSAYAYGIPLTVLGSAAAARSTTTSIPNYFSNSISLSTSSLSYGILAAAQLTFTTVPRSSSSTGAAVSSSSSATSPIGASSSSSLQISSSATSSSSPVASSSSTPSVTSSSPAVSSSIVASSSSPIASSSSAIISSSSSAPVVASSSSSAPVVASSSSSPSSAPVVASSSSSAPVVASSTAPSSSSTVTPTSSSVPIVSPVIDCNASPPSSGDKLSFVAFSPPLTLMPRTLGALLIADFNGWLQSSSGFNPATDYTSVFSCGSVVPYDPSISYASRFSLHAVNQGLITMYIDGSTATQLGATADQIARTLTTVLESGAVGTCSDIRADTSKPITTTAITSSSSSSGLSNGAIAGIIVGVIVGVCCLSFVIFVLVSYMRNGKRFHLGSSESSEAPQGEKPHEVEMGNVGYMQQQSRVGSEMGEESVNQSEVELEEKDHSEQVIHESEHGEGVETGHDEHHEDGEIETQAETAFV